MDFPTSLGFSRARRFQQEVDIHPLPFVGFSRIISLYRVEDWHDDVPDVIASSIRESLRLQVVEPTVALLPWLADRLSIID